MAAVPDPLPGAGPPPPSVRSLGGHDLRRDRLQPRAARRPTT